MRSTRLMLSLSVALLGWGVAMLLALTPLAWVALAIAVLAGLRNKGSQLTGCGTARWAALADVPSMVGGGGLIVGTVDGRRPKLGAVAGLFDGAVPDEVACRDFHAAFAARPPREILRLNDPPHASIYAPTGAGKGRSFVVPFLQTCPDSCVVVDLKAGELARLTADARRAMGHEVHLLDPFRLVTQSPATLNALDFVDRGMTAIDDCREISAAIVERKGEKGENTHFLDNAEAGIAAVCALLVQYGDGDTRSLQALCDVCGSPGNWQTAVAKMCGSAAWGGMLARMGGNLTHLKERELASSMSTMARFLRFLSTPAIAESTRSSSFDPGDLTKRKMTVYLVLSPERAANLSQLIRLWLGILLRGVVKGGLQGRNKVHFVIDEANLVGDMGQISDALTVGRGFGIRLQLYYQDLGQLKKCWPDGGDQTLLANTAQVFFAVNDPETAKYVSERLGKETVVLKSGGEGESRSYKGGFIGFSGPEAPASTSDNWQQAGRELLQPSEVLGLDPRVAVVFAPGVPPLWTRMVRYDEERFGVRSREDGRIAEAACYLLAAAALAALATLLKFPRVGEWLPF